MKKRHHDGNICNKKRRQTGVETTINYSWDREQTLIRLRKKLKSNFEIDNEN